MYAYTIKPVLPKGLSKRKREALEAEYNRALVQAIKEHRERQRRRRIIHGLTGGLGTAAIGALAYKAGQMRALRSMAGKPGVYRNSVVDTGMYMWNPYYYSIYLNEDYRHRRRRRAALAAAALGAAGLSAVPFKVGGVRSSLIGRGIIGARNLRKLIRRSKIAREIAKRAANRRFRRRMRYQH